MILIANGSEVSILVDAAQIIEHKTHYRVRVVSVPSEGLLRQQPKHYQHSILPDGIPVFGLTAGLPVTLEGLIRDNGKVFRSETTSDIRHLIQCWMKSLVLHQNR